MANVEFSGEERALMENASFIFMKNEVISKVYTVFGQVANHHVERAANSRMDRSYLEKPPKISRGENYKGLPYVMLDYPRHFTPLDTLAIRVFFWWGRFFSITLQLKGSSLETYQQSVLAHAAQLAEEGWKMSCRGNEWEHDVHSLEYQNIDSGLEQKWDPAYSTVSFLKITASLSLKDVDQLEPWLSQKAETLFSILHH